MTNVNMLMPDLEALKEKFMSMLEAQGINAEMGLTPAKTVYVMHWEKDGEERDYWFVEAKDAITGMVPYFAATCLEYFLFACVDDEDYENGRYMTGRFEDLKPKLTPEGLNIRKEDMELGFAELAEALKQEMSRPER